MARAAAAAALFDKQIGKSGKSTDAFGRGLTKAEGDTTRLSGTLSRSTRELDSYSGRLGLLASTIGAIGPAAVPITAVAIPAVTGLAQQLGFAALAGGTAVLAFQGVGDALTAMNKAHLEPTEANLEKAREAMERLSPAARDLVLKLGSMREEFGRLKDAAGSGILPGTTAALDDLEKRLPIVERILRQASAAMGDALRDGAESLAGPEWDKFFKFIATEARPELTKLAKSVGNITHGLAEMWVAFGPLNSDFSSWMLKASRDFNEWATGLSKTEGFQEFVAYIRENGPRVGEAVSAIASAMLQIVEAAAPIGGPVLEVITALAKAIGAIADSDLGTPIFGLIAAFSALSLATKAWGGIAGTSAAQFVAGQTRAQVALLGTVSAQQRATMSASAMAARQTAARGAMVRMGGQAAVLGLMMTGVTDKVGLNNTAMLGLAGSMAGPWGAAAGATIGLTMDLAKSNDGLTSSFDRLRAATGAAANDATGHGIADIRASQKAATAEFAKIATGGAGSNLARAWTFMTGGVDDYRRAMSAADTQVAISQSRQRFLALQMGLTSKGYDLATASVEDFDKALAESLGLLSRRDAIRNFQAAIDGVTQSIKENGKSLDIHTEKGRVNQAALDAVASSAIQAAEKINDPIERANFLEGARVALIKAIEQFGIGHTKAQALASELLDLGKIHATPTVDVDTSSASAKVRALRAQLLALDPNLGNLLLPGGPAGMTTPEYNNSTNALDFPKPKHPKDGGFITGPGGPRDDRIPAMISNGEFVVNAAATSRNRGLLETINAQKFADGGLATYASRRDRSYGERAGGTSTSRIAVDLGDLRVVGTLNTPWGPAQVEGIARAAARSEIADSADLAGTHARMYSGGGERG